MAEAAKQLFQGLLTNSNATQYTDPSINGGRTRIDLLIVCNTDTSARTITLDVIPSGGSAGASRRIFSASSIPASTTWFISGPIYVETGGTVQGLASVTNVVNLTAEGVVLT